MSRGLAGEPSFADAFAVLCLQAADKGRGKKLFGDGVGHAREVVSPFLVGELFPETYLEFPLLGAPFLDVTLLYGELAEGTRVDSPLVAGTEAAIDFFVRERARDANINFGFELDCGRAEVPPAAVHFQPRARRDLVAPFCEAAGEPARAGLYLAQDDRMPKGWLLSFFGMFRGRPHAPLRVCGYLGESERSACAFDPSRIGRALEQAGFGAYDDALLAQAARTLSLAPAGADFQLDVLPDGSLGDTFAIDVRFDGMSAPQVRESFARGKAAELMAQLKAWGIADERGDLLSNMAFTRGVSVTYPDGTQGRYGFSLVPGWLKVRWRDGVLQPAKMYLKAGAGPVREGGGVANQGDVSSG